jgi:polyhydroxybutyrate depolymerase
MGVRMKVRVGLAAFLMVSSAAAAQAQGRPDAGTPCDLPHDTGVLAQRLTSGQRPRTYRLFVPPGYDRRQRLPLVLDLHGSGGDAAGQARTSRLEALAATERFVVATLEAEAGSWNVPVEPNRPDDVAYVGDVIDHVSAQACVDPTRIYATGFSGGGRMSSLLGCGLGARLAAIAPVSGLRTPAATCATRPIPVLAFHGLADPQNTYDGHVPGRAAWVESVPDALAGWAAHNKCNPKVVFEDPAGPLSTMRYEGCAAGAEVRLIRIDGLGHRWTHDEVDTTGVMWQFFKAHPLRP